MSFFTYYIKLILFLKGDFIMATLNIDGFTTDYYLVGLLEKEDKNHEIRYYLHFLFNSDKTEGYSTLNISCKKNKVLELVGSVPVVGNVYKVYTDKFMSDGRLITYLKDMCLSVDLQGESS